MEHFICAVKTTGYDSPWYPATIMVDLTCRPSGLHFYLIRRALFKLRISTVEPRPFGCPDFQPFCSGSPFSQRRLTRIRLSRHSIETIGIRNIQPECKQQSLKSGVQSAGCETRQTAAFAHPVDLACIASVHRVILRCYVQLRSVRRAEIDCEGNSPGRSFAFFLKGPEPGRGILC